MRRTINSVNITLLKYFLGITFYFFLIFNIFNSIDVKKIWAVSNPITPTPTSSYGTCKAVVTYSWDISNIPNANRVFWELKKGSDFNNLESREPGRLAGQGSNNVPTGNVTIDLRNYGQVLNGTKYYFRVVAKNDTNDVARRSDSVLFNTDITPNFSSVQLNSLDPFKIDLNWSSVQYVEPDIYKCSQGYYYEVKKTSQFNNLTSAEPNRIIGQAVNGTSTTVDLSNQTAGDYYVRIVGKYGGTSVSDDVGKRGSGVKVTIGQQDTPPPPTPTSTPTPTTPTPTPTPPPPPTTPPPTTQQPSPPTSTNTGELTIRIIDSANRSYISNAEVNLKRTDSPSNPYDITITTGISGIAVFDGLVWGGNFDISAKKTGCEDIQKSLHISSENISDSLRMDCGNVAGDISVDGDISKAILPDKTPPKIKGDLDNINVGGSKTINLDLTSFKLGDGNKFQNARYNVLIEYTSTGLTPAFYRASPCPIRNAEWKPINPNSAPTTNLLKEGKIKYCFQLKSSINIESNIKERRYFVKLMERTIGSGANPIQYAKQKGFKFGARDLIPDSACGFDFNTETLAWNFSNNVKCKYQLFSGRKLNYPWKVKEVRIIRKIIGQSGSDIISSNSDTDRAINFIRKPRGDSLNFTFTVEDTPNLPFSVKVYKFEYVLLGPTDISWQDAFD